jgi:hypothetical protein
MNEWDFQVAGARFHFVLSSDLGMGEVHGPVFARMFFPNARRTELAARVC